MSHFFEPLVNNPLAVRDSIRDQGDQPGDPVNAAELDARGAVSLATTWDD